MKSVMTGLKFTSGEVEITTTLEPYGTKAVDPRMPGNTAAHVERARPSERMTPGKAAKYRKATMKACPCRLCALCLVPPATFAEYEALGLGKTMVEDAGLQEAA